jgi:hypothetical protein
VQRDVYGQRYRSNWFCIQLQFQYIEMCMDRGTEAAGSAFNYSSSTERCVWAEVHKQLVLHSTTVPVHRDVYGQRYRSSWFCIQLQFQDIEMCMDRGTEATGSAFSYSSSTERCVWTEVQKQLVLHSTTVPVHRDLYGQRYRSNWFCIQLQFQYRELFMYRGAVC